MFSKRFAANYDISQCQNIFQKDTFDNKVSLEDKIKIGELIKKHHGSVHSQKTFQNLIMRPLKYAYSKEQIIKAYRYLSKEFAYKDSDFERVMVKKSARGHSGVNVITIFTSPVQFGTGDDTIKKGGCPMNCHYCPFEKDSDGIPTQPRSYLSTEPGNQRATQNSHHPVGQMFDRIFTLEEIGHISNIGSTASKLEIIISGGTFNFYPTDYIEWFVTCMYFAANTYYDYRVHNIFPRDILSLEEEQQINETASLRVIGLTIETRPDYIDPTDYNKNQTDIFENIKFFRKLGITRIQIGVQHTNDYILDYVNRNCTSVQNKKGIKFLKQNGFKVDIHLMLDLPESSPDEDKRMLHEVLTDPLYEADQWKIYPTEITNFTKIKEWYDNSTYKPYSEIDGGSLLEDVIIFAKTLMKPWIRINRVIRDIPVHSIEGGISCPELRQRIEKRMTEQNIFCKCIRCREIKLRKIFAEDVRYRVRTYTGSDGDEYFLSFESKNGEILLGYLRLRLNRDSEFVQDELKNCALIRELHILGKHTELGSKSNSVQHQGYGKNLIAFAEEIAYKNGFNKIAIISGVGVREYYRKLGYHLENTYMVKTRSNYKIKSKSNNIFLVSIFILVYLYFLAFVLDIFYRYIL